ncbi:MAG TPA: hypothetical protein PKC45_11615 [Gemmatales bacterium]|nr:hypothetical protein [Gemmatales bacterium]
MSAPPLTAVCPGCQKSLRIPERLAGQKVKCKQCGTAILVPRLSEPSPSPAEPRRPTSTAADPAAPGAKPPPTPAAANEPLPLPIDDAESTPAAPSLRQVIRRSRPSPLLPIALVGGLLVVLALLAWFFIWAQGSDLLSERPTDARTAPADGPAALPGRTPLVDALRSVTTRAEASTAVATRASTGPKPSPPEPRPLRNAGRIPWPYPARALLIGVKNYVYLSPLNPGYPPERGTGDDPLGLQALQKVLTEDLSLRRDQVIQLSDVADAGAQPPLKSTISASLKEFCKTARASDRLIVLFVGHATLVGEEAYLVPIEGQIDQAETLIPLKEFFAEVAESPAVQKLVILDVAVVDPEQGQFRAAPGPLDAKLAEQLLAPPEGVQVWLSCAPGQQSHQFFSSGFRGSTFLHFLARYARLTDPDHWKRIEKDEALAAGELPLLVLAPHVNQAETDFVQKRWHPGQAPRPVGTRPAAAKESKPPADPPAAVTLARSGSGERPVDPSFLRAVLREIDPGNDPLRRVDVASLPPLSAKAHANYGPDYAVNWRNLRDLKSTLNARPLPVACIDVILGMQKEELRFRTRFRHNPNEAAFKKMLEDTQHQPASAEWELGELLEQLKEALAQREGEKSRRWQAHADLLHARLLGRIIQVREYNFVLGNKLRKDSPTLADKANNNGWVIIPQERLQQRDTRELDQERRKILDQIIADHPGTIWEMLARRERTTWIGLTLQEAKVE